MINGVVINFPGRCVTCVFSSPQNTTSIKRVVYKAVIKAPIMAIVHRNGEPLAALQENHKMESLLKKPAVTSGKAANAAAPARKHQNTTGILLLSPPILKMFC